MANLIDDLSVLTTIKKYNLEELVNKSNMIISHAVMESIRNKESTATVDIGIGKLLVKSEEDTLRFKFIPSTKLESTLIDTYSSGKSLLIEKIDSELGKRIEKTYKDLF